VKIGDKVIFSDCFYRNHEDMNKYRNRVFTVYFVNDYSGIINLLEFVDYNFHKTYLVSLSQIRKDKLNKIYENK